MCTQYRESGRPSARLANDIGDSLVIEGSTIDHMPVPVESPAAKEERKRRERDRAWAADEHAKTTEQFDRLFQQSSG